jgi:hypothetical protein
MELLVRWACHCIEPHWACSYCNGEGTLERWLPVSTLPLLRYDSYILMGRRKTRSFSNTEVASALPHASSH